MTNDHPTGNPLIEQALILARQGQETEAIDLMRRSIQNDPDNPTALGNLGYLLQRRGQIEEAISCYERLRTLQPNDLEVRQRLGDCYYALGRRKEARAAYRSLQGSPLYDSPELQQSLALTESLTSRCLRRLAPTASLLFKRLADPGFLKAFAGEIARIRSSLPGIRAAGLPAYLGYLSQHYLQSACYRHPRSCCDLCGGTRFEAAFFQQSQKSVRCVRCGLQFVERRPPDGFDAHEAVLEKEEYTKNIESLWRDEVLFQARIKRLVSIFGQAGEIFPKPGGRLLEIGCGEGHLLKHLTERSMAVQGIETAERLARHCREALGLPVFKATVRSMEFPPDSFDYVLTYHVVEHLDRPSLLFSKARRMLTAGGYLFIEAPLYDLTQMSLAQKRDEFSGYACKSHMFYFTKETLEKYFERYDFEIVGSFEYLKDSFPNGAILGKSC